MSTRQTQTFHKRFFLWQGDEECAWLAALGAKGWHLQEIKSGFIRPAYVFKKAVPEAFAFAIDYPSPHVSWFRDYMRLCEDAGWTCVAKHRAKYYFRASAQTAATLAFFSGEKPSPLPYWAFVFPVLFGGVYGIGFPLYQLFQVISRPQSPYAQNAILAWAMPLAFLLIATPVVAASVYVLTRFLIYKWRLKKTENTK